MKLRILLFFAVSLSAFLTLAEQNKPLQNKKDQISYAVGVNIGDFWKNRGLETNDVDWQLVLNGFQDAIGNAKKRLNEQEIRAALRLLSGDLRARYEQRQVELGLKNKKEGDLFLAQNKTKPGVHSLPSGVQYKILAEGNGTSPTTNDTVIVQYRGRLLDGSEFDSSYQRNQAQTFKMIHVLKGWSEALQRMKPGAKWQLVIPSELAYRERGLGGVVGPNATLIYDLELVAVQPAPQEASSTGLTSDIIKVPSAAELEKGAKIEIIKPDQIQKEKKP